MSRLQRFDRPPPPPPPFRKRVDSLRVRFVGFAVTACLMIVAVFVSDAIHGRAVATAVASRAAANLAESLAEQGTDMFDAARGALDTLAERVERRGTGPAARSALHDTMTALVKTMPRIHHLFIFDARGEFVVSSVPPTKQRMPPVRNRAYFRYHREHAGTDPYISGPLIGKLDRTLDLVASRRIDRADGTFAGIAIVSVALAYFERTYANVDVGRFGSITLFSDDGTILFRRPSAGANDVGESLAEHGGRFARAGSYTTPPDAYGRAHLFAYRRMGAYPLVVQVGVAENEYLADWQTDLQTKGFALAFIVGIVGVLGVALNSQIGRRKRAEDRLARLALVDGLTGLANRRQFDGVLAREWREARRAGLPLALLMIDVDCFKAYNDRYGHQPGDDALVRISEAIAAEIRRPGDLAARYGGEEFVVILRATDTQSATIVAERLRSAIVALGIEHAGVPGGVASVSIGIAAFVPSRTLAVSRLLEAADNALYDAKRTGRNRVAISAASAVDLALD